VTVKLTVLTQNGRAFDACAAYLKKLAYASEVELIRGRDDVPANSVSVVTAVGEAFLPLAGLIDVQKEIERLEAELRRNDAEIARAGGKLNNKGFVEKAPRHVVEEERAKLEQYRGVREKLAERLASLRGI
jgi:valyl-tRNA synthetase